MITLLKNIECYCPEYMGKKDILIAGQKIYKILDPNTFTPDTEIINVIYCDGLIAFPGIIDGHVHIIGGGGENGFISRIGEIDINDILYAGVTTVVGILGADNQTKQPKSLLAKAKALEAEGITTYIYSGSYSVPIITFSEDITSDMLLIDKVIGSGEIAISDKRSSHASIEEMHELSSKTHIGGLLSNKAGLVHFHLGDGKLGLKTINQLIDETDLPIEQFLPTHLNRNSILFEEGIEFIKRGGNIDLTSGETIGISVPDSVQKLIENKVTLERVTISSDANASTPEGETSKIQTLFDDVINCITQKNMKPEDIFPLVSENVAKRLKLYPIKGKIAEGSDADILITDKNYTLQKLFCMGNLMIDNGRRVGGSK